MALSKDNFISFSGLSWESWANTMKNSHEDKSVKEKSSNKYLSGVMKLPKEDMKIFGLCPEIDTFTVVECKICHSIVKSQALLHHFEIRHMIKDDFSQLITSSQKLTIDEVEQETKFNESSKIVTINEKNKKTHRKSSKKRGKESANLHTINDNAQFRKSLFKDASIISSKKEGSNFSLLSNLVSKVNETESFQTEKRTTYLSNVVTDTSFEKISKQELEQENSHNLYTQNGIAKSICSSESMSSISYQSPNDNLISNKQSSTISSNRHSVVENEENLPSPETSTQFGSHSLLAFTLDYPKPLSAPLLFHKKTGGLFYTNRRMQFVRQRLEECFLSSDSTTKNRHEYVYGMCYRLSDKYEINSFQRNKGVKRRLEAIG